MSLKQYREIFVYYCMGIGPGQEIYNLIWLKRARRQNPLGSDVWDNLALKTYHEIVRVASEVLNEV